MGFPHPDPRLEDEETRASPLLDFSTLEKRRLDCREEVRLNRRLAPGVYLGTTPLTRRPDGALEVRGSGVPVEWLVRMRRLPADRFLDRAIRDATWTQRDIRTVSRRLATFYRGPSRCTCSPITHRRSARRPAARAHRTDGSPRHLDCLEFNRSFSILDPLDEVAYFGLECERLGAADVGDIAIRCVTEALHDPWPTSLLAFHGARRALLRATIALWHVGDDHVADPGRWLRRVAACIALAEGRLPSLASG